MTLPLLTHPGLAAVPVPASAGGGVAHHWATPILLGTIDLTDQRVTPPPAAEGQPVQAIPPGAALADPDVLASALLASVNQLAEANGDGPYSAVDLRVELWDAGYDAPAVSYPADYVAWCVLAVSGGRHDESGAITLADPRTGSNLTAVPGLPWGRQIILRPQPGAHLAIPGWLTSAVAPVEDGQQVLVAIATSLP